MNFTINQYSAIFAIIISIIFVFYKLWCSDEIILTQVVVSIMAGGMLPIAFGFIIYPFYPDFLGKIEEMKLQISVTGIILFIVYLKTIVENFLHNTS